LTSSATQEGLHARSFPVRDHSGSIRFALACFSGLAALWTVEAIHGRAGFRPFLVALIIGLAVSLVSLALTLQLARSAADRLERLAIAASASLLLLGFLPEYVVAGHVWPARSFILVTLAACLFVALYFQASIPARHESSGTLSFAQRCWAIAFLTGYFTWSVFVSLRKLEMLGYAGQDLAYFSQIFYTTVHGRLFNSNFYQDLLYTSTVQSDFAGHNSPIQFLFVFVYRFFPSPKTLLVVRDAAITLCAIPAYRLARNWFSPVVACGFAAIFLLTPAIFFQNVFEFYPFSLAAFFLLFAFDLYARKAFPAFALFLILSLMVREDIVFAAFAFAGLALLQRRTPKWILLPGLFSIAWAILSWRFVLPHFLHGAPFRSNVCFCHLGATAREMVTNIVHHPTSLILTRDNLVYLKQLSTPFLFALPWLSAVTWGALPYLAINLLGGAGECPTTSIFSQHSVVPTTFLFVGFVCAAAWLRNKMEERVESRIRVPFVILAFALSFTIADLAFAVYPEQYAELQYKPYIAEANYIAGLIPPSAPVACPRYMAPLLPNRNSLYMTDDLLDYHHPDPEFVIVDRDFARMRRSPKWRAMYDRVTTLLSQDSDTAVIYRSSNYIVYQRGARSNSLAPQSPK